MRIYRDILKNSWQVMWYNPWLWILGFGAALAGVAGEYSIITEAIKRMKVQADSLSTLQAAIQYDKIIDWWSMVATNISAEPWLFVTSVLFSLFLFMVFIWLTIVGQAGLVVGISALDDNKKLTVVQAARVGLASFWPIFIMNFLVKFFTYLVFAVAFLPFLIYYLVGQGGTWAFDSIHLLSFILAIPLSVIISFILRYAMVAIVLESKTWWHALERGINIFLKNWLVSLEMATILQIISVVVNMGVFLLISREVNIDTLFLFTSMTWLDFFHALPTILIFIAAGIWLVTFQYACWVLLFKRLDREAVTPKIVRLVYDLPQYMKVWWKKPSLIMASKAKRR